MTSKYSTGHYYAEYNYTPLPSAHPMVTPTTDYKSYAQMATNMVSFYENGTELDPCCLDVWDTPVQYGDPIQGYAYTYNHVYPTLSRFSLQKKPRLPYHAMDPACFQYGSCSAPPLHWAPNVYQHQHLMNHSTPL